MAACPHAILHTIVMTAARSSPRHRDRCSVALIPNWGEGGGYPGQSWLRRHRFGMAYPPPRHRIGISPYIYPSPRLHRWDQFVGWWNRLAYRFSACAEHHEEYRLIFRQHGGDRRPKPILYFRDRELYGFFTTDGRSKGTSRTKPLISSHSVLSRLTMIREEPR